MCSSAIEIPYGDKDQKGDYTLQPGDMVEFNIATDRRDKLQRATCITLVPDTFKVNGEQREKVSGGWSSNGRQRKLLFNIH